MWKQSPDHIVQYQILPNITFPVNEQEPAKGAAVNAILKVGRQQLLVNCGRSFATCNIERKLSWQCSNAAILILSCSGQEYRQMVIAATAKEHALLRLEHVIHGITEGWQLQSIAFHWFGRNALQDLLQAANHLRVILHTLQVSQSCPSQCCTDEPAGEPRVHQAHRYHVRSSILCYTVAGTTVSCNSKPPTCSVT